MHVVQKKVSSLNFLLVLLQCNQAKRKRKKKREKLKSSFKLIF